MTTYVSFLRGINVGGTNKIKMSDLAILYEKHGCANVETVLQTGNVQFDASKPPDIAQAIERKWGYNTTVITRKKSYLVQLFDSDPFADYPDLKPNWKMVLFLTGKPKAQAIDAIPRQREVIWGKKNELYLTFPDGVGRSKVTLAKVEKALGLLGTMRNWNTLVKIVSA